MKPMKGMTRDALIPMCGWKVVDLNGKPIGRLREFHVDPATKRVELLGVQTRWLFGHFYLLPSDMTSVDEAHHVIHLPHTELFIKAGPSVDRKVTSLDSDIFDYYGVAQPERWRQHIRERSQSQDRGASIK